MLRAPFTRVGTLAHKHVAHCDERVEALPYKYPRGVNRQRQGEECERVPTPVNGGGRFFWGLPATDSRTASMLAWDMVTAELPLCVLCSVCTFMVPRAIKVLQKYHDELAAGCIT